MSHCNFWTSCKAYYGKLRLMTKCSSLKLLEVFDFPLISFTTQWKGWFIFFSTVIICLTPQILCRQKTSSELCVCWDPAYRSLALSHFQHWHQLLIEMWILILSWLGKTSESFQVEVKLKYFLVYLFAFLLMKLLWYLISESDLLQDFLPLPASFHLHPRVSPTGEVPRNQASQDHPLPSHCVVTSWRQDAASRSPCDRPEVTTSQWPRRLAWCHTADSRGALPVLPIQQLVNT